MQIIEGFVRTLQLSIDILEASGFDKSKAWAAEMSCRKPLKGFINTCSTAESRPDLYGFVESATHYTLTKARLTSIVHDAPAALRFGLKRV